MPFEPTPEQKEILGATRTGDDLIIEAGAGTGKTSTLELIGRQDERRRGTYIAYNRAIANDAKARFPRNVACSTAHSLAFRSVGVRYKNRLDGPRLNGAMVASRLGIGREIRLGNLPAIKTSRQGSMVMETISAFCQSSDEHLSLAHALRAVADLPLEDADKDRIASGLLPFAELAWRDLNLPTGMMKFEHDHYLKIWALQNPRLDGDFVLLDEAQDANPVIAGVVEKQTHLQRILVGDACQAIYGWRGATDAMATFTGRRLQLTQSFRFGPAIATEANKWLAYLQSDLRLRGFDPIGSRLDTLDQPDAILCRTNAMAMNEAIQGIAEGRRTAIVGGGDAIRRLAFAANDLMEGRATDHPELFMFPNWTTVVEYVTQERAGADLKVLVNLVDSLGADEILRAVDELIDEREADLVISTAHKAKGREWDTVRIADDFRKPKGDTPLPREEAMLAYVAVTRAKKVLDRTGLAWVDQLNPSGGLTANVAPTRANDAPAQADLRLPNGTYSLWCDDCRTNKIFILQEAGDLRCPDHPWLSLRWVRKDGR